MCVGENSAAHTIAYLNAQIQALWNISTECVARHGTYLKPDPGHRAYPLLIRAPEIDAVSTSVFVRTCRMAFRTTSC